VEAVALKRDPDADEIVAGPSGNANVKRVKRESATGEGSESKPINRCGCE
jgi:hypothetical protein